MLLKCKTCHHFISTRIVPPQDVSSSGDQVLILRILNSDPKRLAHFPRPTHGTTKNIQPKIKVTEGQCLADTNHELKFKVNPVYAVLVNYG
jgi:hypothetical protein